jgi:hypothetical protein
MFISGKKRGAIMNNLNTIQAIWCSVGLMLSSIGCVILLSGLTFIIFHIQHQTVLANLHPDVWWGGIMLAVGLTFFLINYNRR